MVLAQRTTVLPHQIPIKVRNLGFTSVSKRLTVHCYLLVIPTRSSTDLRAFVQTLEMDERRNRSYQNKWVYIYWN